MRDDIEILDEYSSAFRDLVNTRVGVQGEPPASLLRLNSSNDWSFICVAMDIVGDSSLAMHNFARFSLDGPTKYEEVGERYLRLYGLLSAVYIQQQALIKLYSLTNCPSPAEKKKQFELLKIRELRHKLSSHGLDYLESDRSVPYAYVPVRMELQKYSCTITKNRGDSSETVNIGEALSEHCKLAVSVLDSIYEKSVKTLFKGQQTRIDEFNEKLEELRALRRGAVIFRAPQNGNTSEVTRVVIDAAKDEPNI
jgi:hypothetical protein